MSAISEVALLIQQDLASPVEMQDPTPAPTPGPFLQLIEQLLKTILPMLVACIPAVATQTRVINRPRLLHREQLMATIVQQTPPEAPQVAIYHATLNVGAKLKQDQVQAMQDEIKSGTV